MTDKIESVRSTANSIQQNQLVDADIEQSLKKLSNACEQLTHKLATITQNSTITDEYQRYIDENIELHNIIKLLKDALNTERNENKNIRRITSEVMDEISDYIIELEQIKKNYADITTKNK